MAVTQQQPMKVDLKRPVKLFERLGPWLGLGAILSFFSGSCIGGCALMNLSDADQLLFGPNLRGYTFMGVLGGIGAVFFAFLCFWYMIRKRRNVTGSSMMTWLSMHVVFGLFALFLAFMHAGMGLFSLSFSTGKVLFFLFFVIASTGILWRLAYATIPPKAAEVVLNYSKEGAVRRAEEQSLEIEKLVAGKSAELRAIKDVLLQRTPSPQELAQMAQTLKPDEQAILPQLAERAASRRRALARPIHQQEYTKRMHRWRAVHVPLSFLFFLFLGFHVFGAYDMHRKLVPAGLAETGPLAAYLPAEKCADCHKAIYDQWKDSMHAHALSSPLTIVQNNLDMKHSLVGLPSPDPRRLCINCHGPATAASIDGDNLPLRPGRQIEGIECTSCHQLSQPTKPGGGALAGQYNANLVRGDVYYGPLSGPIGNAYHKSDTVDMWKDPTVLCSTCHDVNYDKNNDGQIHKAVDLVLQTTFDEYQQYRKGGGKSTCMDCHMPVVPGLTNAADGASVPFDRDYTGPKRVVHDHSFVGVDYPLDVVKKKDPQRPKRQALLQSAANFDVEQSTQGNLLVLKCTITNNTGHNLPTGFAFARQMWIELTVQENGKGTIFQSGGLAHPGDDLCDDGTFGEATNPLRPFVRGCTAVDPNLVNIQLKLVDKIAALADGAGNPVLDQDGEHVLIQSKDGKETYLQWLTAGGVARTRPVDKANLAPIRFLESKSFVYKIPVERGRTGTWTARLLFRNLPPYWVRGMTTEDPGKGVIRLDPLVDNILTEEMARKSGSFVH